MEKTMKTMKLKPYRLTRSIWTASSVFEGPTPGGV
jgi:hypothetical protein